MAIVRPRPSIPRDYEFPSAERFALANGLRVVVAPIKRLPLVSVRAVIDAGAAGDARGDEGLAMMCAAALAEGTASRDGPALADAFERIGTSLESGADWDSATASLTVMRTHLDDAIALLAEVLTEPRFSDADVERLKSERLAELLQQRVEPRGLADECFARTAYDESSRYARARDGTPRSVRGLDVARVRAWYAARFSGATTTIVVAGDVDAENVAAMLDRRLGGWVREVHPARSVDAEVRSRSSSVHVVAKAGAPQSEVRIGHVGLARGHRDFFVAVVMNAILGGLFSSRINLNLREAHAYTYGAHSAFDWRRAAGPFVVATAVKTEVTDAAVREVLAEINRIRSAEVSVDELDLATKYLAGVFPIRYETTEGVAAALAMAVVHELPDDYFTTYRSRIMAVSCADVLAAARAHLHPDAMQVLAVGDADEISEPLAVLNLGAPALMAADEGEDE